MSRANAVRKLKFVATATGFAGLGSFFTAQAGHRKESAREGALTGAVYSIGALGAPSVARVVGRGLAHGKTGKIVKKAMSSGKVIFRRIRGRIVRFRSK